MVQLQNTEYAEIVAERDMLACQKASLLTELQYALSLLRGRVTFDADRIEDAITKATS